MSAFPSNSSVVYLNGEDDYLEMYGRNAGGFAGNSDFHHTEFSAHLITGQSTGGSGGGSYTPEKMVWEDVTAERAVDTEYTNTNDVPLYVQLYVIYQMS